MQYGLYFDRRWSQQAEHHHSWTECVTASRWWMLLGSALTTAETIQYRDRRLASFFPVDLDCIFCANLSRFYHHYGIFPIPLICARDSKPVSLLFLRKMNCLGATRWSAGWLLCIAGKADGMGLL